MYIRTQKLLEKNIKREKTTGRPHLKNLNNIFCLIKKSFILAFLDHIYPLTNQYVINFSKKLLSYYYQIFGFQFHVLYIPYLFINKIIRTKLIDKFTHKFDKDLTHELIYRL